MPGSFDGAEESWRYRYENDGATFVLSIKPSAVLKDPRHVDSYLLHQHKVKTSDDSSRHEAIKAGMKKYAGSDMELEFRCDLPFPCKESLDLGEPFVAFFEVEIGPKKIPNLSFVHCSIDPVEC